MLVLRALNSDIGRQHVGIFKLCLRLCHIRFWSCTALEAVLRQPQGFGIGLYGIVQKSFLGIGASHLEIVDRNSAWRLKRDVCRSAALAWACCLAAATLRRTRPHRSTPFERSRGRVKSPVPLLTALDGNKVD